MDRRLVRSLILPLLALSAVGCGAQTEPNANPGAGPTTPATLVVPDEVARGYRWEASDAFASLDESPSTSVSPDDRYVVRLGGADAQVIADAGGSVLYPVDEGLVAARLTPSQLSALRESGIVEGVDVDPRRYLMGEQVPYGVSMVQAPEISLEPGTGRIEVCVIDSGYAMGHEDLPIDVSGADDSGTGVWNVDGCGHGTHVAGTIAALRNQLGVVGVAPEMVRLHVVKVFDDNCDWTYSSILVRAVYECVDAGANIISMSLGGSGPYWFEQLAFEWADLRGVLSVAAAGNAGSTDKSYPASYDEVISVAAIDGDGKLASFSQRNDQIELAAPGVGVLSTVPGPGGGGYAFFDGTSMATPHVSAVAAMVWSRYPSFSNRQVRRALRDSAFDVWPEGRDSSTGFGLVQAVGALNELHAVASGGGGTNGSSSSDGTCTCPADG